MQQFFDYYNQYEKPDLVLCNPNKSELYSLNAVREFSLKWRYNALSELNFVIDKTIDGVENPAYELVKSKRLVKVSGYGYFMITKPIEDTSITVPNKKVTAVSLEAELINKRIVAFKGTYKFYDPVSPANTLLNYIITLAPSWSVGTVDAELWTIFRTFDISDSNVYNFLMNDVENSYGCIFIFDTVNKTISAKLAENATIQTDIFIGKENLIESTSLEEISDEIVTAMAVYGGNGLNIRNVNPLGGNYIYNFSYYKNTEWMSSELVTAITNWEAQVTAQQSTYAGYLTNLFTANEELLTLQSSITTLQGELAALEGVQKIRIEANAWLPNPGTSFTPNNTVLLSQINSKKSEITTKQSEITSKQNQITSIQTLITNIVTSLSFENNFTPSELDELQSFIIENTYQNKNIIVTDGMTEAEIQTQAQSLYDDALTVLEKASQPRYQFSVDSVNFVFLKEFQKFTEQLELGSIVTLNTKEGTYIETVLLEMSIDFNKPDTFELVFGNRLRLDGADYRYTDLFNNQSRAASSVDFNGAQWSNWDDNYKDDVSTFITSSLDASLNNVVNASNQEILIDVNGLRGKKYLPDTQTYSPNQVWLTSSTLAFTKDAWNTASLAIGQITVNGSQVYGVVADVLQFKVLE